MDHLLTQYEYQPFTFNRESIQTYSYNVELTTVGTVCIEIALAKKFEILRKILEKVYCVNAVLDTFV